MNTECITEYESLPKENEHKAWDKMRQLVILLDVWPNLLSGLRFVQEIKIIFKYRDCLKVLRIVICKYKDLVVFWVLGFKETPF